MDKSQVARACVADRPVQDSEQRRELIRRIIAESRRDLEILEEYDRSR